MHPAPKGAGVRGGGDHWLGLAAPSSVLPLPMASVLSPNPLREDQYVASAVWCLSVCPSFPGMHPSSAHIPEPSSTLRSATLSVLPP